MLIACDGEKAPAYSMDQFTPSTVPGCRTPHLWLADGRSLYEVLGPVYTLLRFGTGLDVQPLIDAAALRGMPLDVLDVESPGAQAVYRHSLVLSRPDQHVAWRGDTLPQNPLALVDLVRGGDDAQ
jgi:hypothetical protein